MESRPNSKSIKTNEKRLFKRLISERQLENILDWEFEDGFAYHVISEGDIDALSFLKHILKQQALEYLACSTWCMAMADIVEIERYLELKRILRLDTYVGEIFKGTYMTEYSALWDLHNYWGGRVAIFRNHSKVFCGFGEKFDFVIETSANINGNPRAENTVITINRNLALFYKDFFDNIIDYQKEFQDWKPYQLCNT